MIKSEQIRDASVIRRHNSKHFHKHTLPVVLIRHHVFLLLTCLCVCCFLLLFICFFKLPVCAVFTPALIEHRMQLSTLFGLAVSGGVVLQGYSRRGLTAQPLRQSDQYRIIVSKNKAAASRSVVKGKDLEKEFGLRINRRLFETLQ